MMIHRKTVMYLIDPYGQIVHVYVPKRSHYRIGQVLNYSLRNASTISGQAIFGMDLFESEAEAQNRLNELEMN